MTNMTNRHPRAAAHAYLATTTGTPTPQWRTGILEYDPATGEGRRTTVVPVCPTDDHDTDDDPTVYDCCPEPAIETDSEPLAAYLVALLNADRETQP